MASSIPLFNALTAELILEKYPLHWYVWSCNTEKLDELLHSKLHDQEKLDPHGRTPLHLAVALGYVDVVSILLSHMCDASATNKHGWTVTQEAVATGDVELVSLIIQHREYQRLTQKGGGISEILESLEEADDFYVEMKWEFSSWVPLLSRICPSDSYKIWKSGANVRVDTTLKGFDQMSWQRGNMSFIFKGGARSSTFLEIDHDRKAYWKESVSIRDESVTLQSMRAPVSVVSSKMTSPNVASVLDHEQIAFTRQKSGLLGWGGDRTDTINGYECKVYSVSGVELVTRTRTEHMTESDRRHFLEERARLQSNAPAFLNILEPQEKEEAVLEAEVVDRLSTNPFNLSLEDYFNPKAHPGKDVGRLRKMTCKSQKFSASIALCDKFPLSLQDQILPIINLMANSSSHFAKLRDFITLQLPAGFPIKIEIPLFHVLNARVTFANLNGSEICPDGVVLVQGDSVTGLDGPSSSTTSKCVIDKSTFEIYAKYKDLGVDIHTYDVNDAYRGEEDDLMQLAIQQSLVDRGALRKVDDSPDDEDITLVEALEKRQNALINEQHSGRLPPTQTWLQDDEDDDNDLQRAIRASIREAEESSGDRLGFDVPTATPAYPSRALSEDAGSLGVLSEDDQLRILLEMSKKEQEDRLHEIESEEEQLRRILELSLVDK